MVEMENGRVTSIFLNNEDRNDSLYCLLFHCHCSCTFTVTHLHSWDQHDGSQTKVSCHQHKSNMNITKKFKQCIIFNTFYKTAQCFNPPISPNACQYEYFEKEQFMRDATERLESNKAYENTIQRTHFNDVAHKKRKETIHLKFLFPTRPPNLI